MDSSIGEAEDFIANGGVVYLEQFVPSQLQTVFLDTIEDSNNFSWYYSESIVDNAYDTGGFSHIILRDDKENSYCASIFMSLMALLGERTGIEADHIIRFRIRMTLPDGSGPRSNIPHVDHMIPHTVLLVYLNDSDGDTVIYDKTFDEGPENLIETARFNPNCGDAILFDGRYYHSGAVPSKRKRIVANIDFITKEKA